MPKEETVFVFPATSAQQRFWLLDQLRPEGNPALNMSVPLRWTGPLELAVLQRAWQEVVRRHEALRTIFKIERGELQQVILPDLEVYLPFSEDSESVLSLAQNDARQTFDLLVGPLFRARIIRLAPSKHLFLLTLHHIISDGWSNGVIARDLCAFYSSFLSGRPSVLPELTLQFPDFAEWQAQRLANKDFEAQLAYWQAQLEGSPASLDLCDLGGLSSQPETGAAAVSITLEPHLVQAAITLAAAERASPFMIFLAAFQILLHRYTREVDFLITSPSANRDRPEFQSLVGLFVNPLILRADLRGDPTVGEFLERVQRTALDAFAHQDIPFESLLDEFNTAKLQANFHYDAGWQPPSDLPDDVVVDLVSVRTEETIYELSATVTQEGGGGMRVEFEYDRAVFDAQTIRRMLDHYEQLLKSAVADPAERVSSLSMLTPNEQSRFGASSVPARPTFDLREILATRIMKRADAVVARHGRREFSCAELLAQLDGGPGAVSNLQQAASLIAQWRARLD
ncbi:MAG: condensation domain-containing protein, partial [Verrucomicrobiota bacterium]|nr:condensation domain-containing protein [Verrucomicrobiota bacterium]